MRADLRGGRSTFIARSSTGAGALSFILITAKTIASSSACADSSLYRAQSHNFPVSESVDGEAQCVGAERCESGHLGGVADE